MEKECNDVAVCRVWRCGRSCIVRKSSKTLHGRSSCYAHVALDGDEAKAVDSRTTIMKGLDHRSFAQVDCGDEVKELCEFAHFLGPAPRREHVMS